MSSNAEIAQRAILQKTLVESEMAMVRLEREKMLSTPAFMLKPTLSKDGDQWCVLYGKDIQTGLAGFGKTPAAAYQDFNRQFLGSGTCIYCGCTDETPCVGFDSKPCHWVDEWDTVCSACMEKQAKEQEEASKPPLIIETDAMGNPKEN